MASRGVNKVILIGNLGAKPEVRYFSNGDAWANVSVATSETWKDKNTGQPQERTEWHRVVFTRRLAEIVGEYLDKGSKIYVEGSIRYRQYEKDGVKQYITEIVANEMQMLDRAGENAGAARSGGGGGYAAPAKPAAQRPGYGSPEPHYPSPDALRQPEPAYPSRGGGVDDGFDDDIPF